jgi:hypothetical protein
MSAPKPPLLTPLVSTENEIETRATEERMDDILTLQEIEAGYAPEWVLIGDPQTDESLRLQAGKVLFHSSDRDAVCRRRWSFHRVGSLRFLGEHPADVVLVL